MPLGRKRDVQTFPAKGQNHSFGRDPYTFELAAGIAQNDIDSFVGGVGIVVEKDQVANTGSLRGAHARKPAGVSPALAGLQLLRRVLRVVDEDIGAIRQFN